MCRTEGPPGAGLQTTTLETLLTLLIELMRISLWNFVDFSISYSTYLHSSHTVIYTSRVQDDILSRVMKKS